MGMSKTNNARYKESRKLRDKDSNANTKICFEVRTTALCLCLHIEGFSLCPQRDLHRGITTYKIRSIQLQLSHTSTQEGRHKPSTKQREIQLSDPMITNNTWLSQKTTNKTFHNIRS